MNTAHDATILVKQGQDGDCETVTEQYHDFIKFENMNANFTKGQKWIKLFGTTLSDW